MGNPDNETLFTVDETARRLSISRSRVFQFLKSRDLRGVSLGYRSRRVLRSSVDEFIARQVAMEKAAMSQKVTNSDVR